MKSISTKNSGIYKITCIATNKVYIGSSSNLNRRKREHYGLLRKNTHGNVYLQHSWNKYKEENFIFLNIETGVEVSILYERERYWIDYYKALEPEFGYNLSYPCDGRGTIFHSELTKEKLRRKGFEQFYKDSNITYEEWLIQKSTPKKYHDIYEGKHVLVISMITGEIVGKYISLKECGRSFSVGYKVIQKVVDVPTRGFKNLRVVSEVLYDKNKDYTKKRKAFKYQYKTPYKVQVSKDKKDITVCVLDSTGNIIESFNTPELFMNTYSISLGAFKKVIYGERKCVKGLRFQYRRNLQLSSTI